MQSELHSLSFETAFGLLRMRIKNNSPHPEERVARLEGLVQKE